MVLEWQQWWRQTDCSLSIPHQVEVPGSESEFLGEIKWGIEVGGGIKITGEYKMVKVNTKRINCTKNKGQKTTAKKNVFKSKK